MRGWAFPTSTYRPSRDAAVASPGLRPAGIAPTGGAAAERGGYDLVGWDDWLDLDERELALVVAAETPGEWTAFHEIVRR